MERDKIATGATGAVTGNREGLSGGGGGSALVAVGAALLRLARGGGRTIVHLVLGGKIIKAGRFDGGFDSGGKRKQLSKRRRPD